MQQQIRQYTPDNGSGSGKAKNSGSTASTESSLDRENGGDLDGMGSDGSGSTGSGPTNLNDDDLGTAGLGVANIGSSAIGDVGLDTDDTGNTAGSMTFADDWVEADSDATTSTNSDGGLDSGTPIPTADLLAAIGTMPTTAEPRAISDQPSTGATDLTIDPDLTQSQQKQTSPSPLARGNGKTALVTGASSGIGRELANLFAQDGYNLVLVARSEGSLQQIAQEYEQQFGIAATVISYDLADPSSPEAIYAETQRQGIHVDILVNNAGLGEYGLFANESDLQKELALIQVNSASLVHLTKLYLKDMVTRNEGKILLLGSVASVIPHPLMAVYGATKAFNYSFGEALRNELKDTNITVTVLMPPATDTDFFNKAGSEHTVIREQARSRKPAEVAKAGYDALMAGKDKVAAGLSAKLQVASAHILPDQLLTQNMRNLLKPRQQAEQEKKQAANLALMAGAVVLAGWWLLSRSR